MSEQNLSRLLQALQFVESQWKILKNNDGNYTLCAGATVPDDGSSGYSAGCIWIDTDASGESSFKINAGSSSSCNFDSMEIGLQSDLASTTNSKGASMIGIEDSAVQITATTVEAALAELALHARSTQQFIPIPLTSLREVSSNNIPTDGTADEPGGGLLSQSSTPILEFTNGDSDSALRLNWAASNSDAIVFQTPLPPNLNTGSNLVLHMRGASAGTDDKCSFDADTYFNEGDTKVSDNGTFAAGTTYAEGTLTIAAADIPSGAQTVTCELTPTAHTTDAVYLTSMWLEYTGLTLTS